MFSFIKNIQTVDHAIQDNIDNKPPYRNRLKLKRQQQEENERKRNEIKEKFSELISLPDEKYYTNFKKEDVTILLQGILNKDVDIFETIELYSLSGHIVLSVYDDDYTKNICNQILELYPNDVTVVYNNLETYQKELEEIKKRYNDRIINNFYFQLKTTINGLQHIHTKYVVKSRVDHYYSDIDKFIAHGIVTKKLVSSSFAITGLLDKKHRTYYFHMSDILFFGETLKIKQMIYLANKMCFTPIMFGKPAEIRLWKPYLIMLAESEGLKLDDTHIKHGEDYEYMMKYVIFLNSKITVYPIHLHNNFKIKLGKNIIYTKNNKAPIYNSFYYFIEGIGYTMDNIIEFKSLKDTNDNIIPFKGHYDDWTKNRMSAIKKYINQDFLINKYLLELGGGYGNNGNEFYKLGCKVTSTDARLDHIEIGKLKYPNIKFEIIDGDKDQINKKYDIILHWGLLYHLNEIENHLHVVCKNCDVLLLETEVADSDDDKFYITTNENGYDQAYNNNGIRPSFSYVEKILSNNEFKYFMIKDSIINSSFHEYDWEIKNTKTCKNGLRRFWICWNKNIDISNLFYNSIL